MTYQPPTEPGTEHDPATVPELPGPEPLGPPPRRWNWRVMIIIFVIAIPVLFGIYFAWLSFRPPDPSGSIPAALALVITSITFA